MIAVISRAPGALASTSVIPIRGALLAVLILVAGIAVPTSPDLHRRTSPAAIAAVEGSEERAVETGSETVPVDAVVEPVESDVASAGSSESVGRSERSLGDNRTHGLAPSRAPPV